MLEGEDLFAVDRHLQRLQRQRGESGAQGWSGVEHAMWDAIGRAAGLPVARLLGGSRDRLKVYRTCVFPGKPDQSDVTYETQAEYAVRPGAQRDQPGERAGQPLAQRCGAEPRQAPLYSAGGGFEALPQRLEQRGVGNIELPI